MPEAYETDDERWSVTLEDCLYATNSIFQWSGLPINSSILNSSKIGLRPHIVFLVLSKYSRNNL